jgi:hypothetical protein
LDIFMTYGKMVNKSTPHVEWQILFGTNANCKKFKFFGWIWVKRDSAFIKFLRLLIILYLIKS